METILDNQFTFEGQNGKNRNQIRPLGKWGFSTMVIVVGVTALFCTMPLVWARRPAQR